MSKINGKETRGSCKKTQQAVGIWSGKKQVRNHGIVHLKLH